MATIEKNVEKRSLDTLYRCLGNDVMNYLNDKNVFEIAVNPDGKLWTDTYDKGRIFTGITMYADMVENVILQVASMTQQTVNEEHPTLSAELPDGSRFQGFLPRVVKSASFLIRKHSLQIFTLDDYVEQKILTIKQSDILRKKIKDKKNIVVAGGTKTGKTTFLNAILAEISKMNERIVIIEDKSELRCTAEDYLSLETTEYCDQYFLLNETLRASPDRIVLGEIRKNEALALLDAWSTGHGGGCTSIHSNSAYETLIRLQDMVSRVSVTPQQRTIAAAVDIIVYMKKKGLSRYVKEIIEVTGYDEKTNYYKYEQIA